MVRLFQIYGIFTTYRPVRMIRAPSANSCSLHAFFTKADVSLPQYLPVAGRSDFQKRCLKARDIERHSGQSLAAALLATVLLASPAFAKAPSSEYISVQDRVHQRAPLQRQQSGYNNSNDAAPALQAKMRSIPQQAGHSHMAPCLSTACVGILYPKSPLTYR